MSKFTCFFVLVTLNYGLFEDAKRTVKWVYKPYGPKMCTELCEDSSYSFHYIVEDLACRRISKKSHLSEVPFTCMERNPSRTIPLGLDVCKTENADYLPKAQLQTADPAATVKLESAQHIPNMTLHQACGKGKLDVVKYILLRKPENINHREKTGMTPIMVAALNRQVAVFDFLFNQGCDLSSVDYNKNTVLHSACSGGNTYIVKKLLDTGKYSHVHKNINGWTPVLNAAFYGHTETLGLLVSRNFSVKVITYNGNNLLHWACFNGHMDTVKYILSHDIVDIDSRGVFRRTPVMTAVERNHRKIFNLLVCKGSNLKLVDGNNNTILHSACVGGEITITKYILSLNLFDINCGNNKGQTPVMIASMKGHKDVFDLLVTEGCNLRKVDKQQTNILHTACVGGNIDIVKYILSLHIFDIDSPGCNGRTPVIFSADRGRREVFDLLISKGCNLQAVDKDSNNALHVACIGGHVNMIKYILALKNINIDVKGFMGRTPAMIAAQFGEISVLRFLLNEGCNLKALDEQGNNILHVACLNGRVNIVRYLITIRAVKEMVKKKNYLHDTPVELAKLRGHWAVIRNLKN